MGKNDRYEEILNKLKNFSSIAVQKYNEFISLENESQDPFDVRFLQKEKELSLVREVEDNLYQELFQDREALNYLKQKYAKKANIKISYLYELFSNPDLVSMRMIRKIQHYFLMNAPDYAVFKPFMLSYSQMVLDMLFILETEENLSSEIKNYIKYMSYCVDPILEKDYFQEMNLQEQILLEDSSCLEAIKKCSERTFMRTLDEFLRIPDKQYIKKETEFFTYLKTIKLRALAKKESSLKLNILKKTMIYQGKPNCDRSYETILNLFDQVFEEDKKILRRTSPFIKY